MAYLTREGKRAPTFLGVGPPKCGTTWLDACLRRHPEVMLPEHQKEVFFFSRYYDRGVDWYEALFSGAENAFAAGEISTNYILGDKPLRRISDFDSSLKIIVLLRNPTDRLVSHYRMMVENAVASWGLEETVSDKPYIIQYSAYRERLDQVSRFFSKGQVFLAIYEEIFADRESQVSHLEKLAEFLGVDPRPMRDLIPDGKQRETLGASRFPRVTRLAKRARRKLLDADMEWLVDMLRRAGVDRKLFLKKSTSTRPPVHILRKYDEMFAPDRTAVEEYLGRPIPSWNVIR